MVPDARIIVLLREPIDRVWSQYRWQRWWGGETLDLADALRAEAERAGDGFEMMGADRQTRNRFISHGYLARSRYADQLEWWLDAFPADQLLVLRSEDLFADPAAVARPHVRLPRTAAVRPVDLRRRRTAAPTTARPTGRSTASCGPGSTTTSPSPTAASPSSPPTLSGGPITWP